MTKFTMKFRHLLCLFILAFFSMIVVAQDSTSTSVTTTTTSKETTWYTSPWVWVAGAAVFVLLLAAILRGNSNRSSAGTSDRVTVTKTVRRDTDTDV